MDNINDQSGETETKSIEDAAKEFYKSVSRECLRILEVYIDGNTLITRTHLAPPPGDK